MAKPLPWLKPGLLVGGIAPGALIVIGAARGTLAANPISEALNRFGLLALIFLVASLCCTPLKSLFGWTWPPRIRRMLGLFSFGYASVHVCTYVGLDQVLDLAKIGEDLVKRKFILVGFLAWALLVPLAITSTNKMVKRLGYVRWQRLHRLVYPAAILAAIHFYWRVKRDHTEPLVYAALLGVLLLIRVGFAWKKRFESAGVGLRPQAGANPSGSAREG